MALGEKADRPTLLVLRALGLGDLLTAVPALRALARAFPRHRRLLAAPDWLQPLLPLLPEGDGACLHDLVPISGLDGDPASLPPRADLAIDLHGRGPQSHRLLLATKPRGLIAFANAAIPETASFPAWQGDEHEAERWCRLLSECGIEADPTELDVEAPQVDVPAWARGATLIHPGAASAARRWPAERWSAVARAEREAGREVLITGSRREVGLARSIVAAAGLEPTRAVAGRTDVLRLAAFVAAAGMVVCGDTGVAHLATGLRVPSVLLFGPTSPRSWGPPEDRPIHRVLWGGGQGDPHADRTDPGLLEIEAAAVLEALQALRPIPA